MSCHSVVEGLGFGGDRSEEKSFSGHSVVIQWSFSCHSVIIR